MYKKNYHDEKYRNLIKEIDLLFESKDYEYCLQKTKDFLKLIKKDNADFTNYRFAYVSLSKVYNKLGDKKSALSNIIKARQYLRNSDVARKILVDWQTGMCYKNINNKKALVYFKKCYNKSSEINDYEYMGGVLDEIALINKNINTMLCAIDLYSNCETLSYINKQDGLDEMYGHLFQLYIYYNNEFEAYKILQNINNKNLVNELKNELNVYKLV